MLGPEEVRSLLDSMREKAPGLVEAIHPDPLSLAAITRLLRALLSEGIPLSHPLPILSSMALGLQITKDFDPLVDHIRADLGSWLVGQVCSQRDRLGVVTLDAALEGAILGGMKDPVTGQPVIEPDCARMIGDRMNQLLAEQADGRSLALIVQPPARRALASLLRQRAPHCLVLSIAELPPSQPVEVVAVIGGEQPPQIEHQPPEQQSDALMGEVLAA